MDIKHPEYMKGNTAQQWMWYRRKGVKDWITKGIVYIDTDEQGKYKDYEIKQAFEFHVQEDQLVCLRHPNCMKNEAVFMTKVRRELESIHYNLQERY
jgi:hypothetical protein